MKVVTEKLMGEGWRRWRRMGEDVSGDGKWVGFSGPLYPYGFL